MHELVKPDGTKVTVNDTSLAYALSLGWKAAKVEAKQHVNSRKRSK